LQVGWCSAPDPAGGAYSGPTDRLAVFKGPTSKGRQGVEGGESKGRKREYEGEGGKKRGNGRRGEGIFRTNAKLLPTSL